MNGRFAVTYHVRGTAADIEARARGIAVEQSVEMPLAAIQDAAILSDIVGTVEDIDDIGDGVFAVRIGLATETVGHDAGQFLNMIFGNTSLHEDVVLKDVIVPDWPDQDVRRTSARCRRSATPPGRAVEGVDRLGAEAAGDVAEAVGVTSRAPRARGPGFYQR